MMVDVYEALTARAEQWYGYAMDDVLFLVGMCASEDETREAIKKGWMRARKELAFECDLYRIRKAQTKKLLKDIDRKYTELGSRVTRLYKGSLDD